MGIGSLLIGLGLLGLSLMVITQPWRQPSGKDASPEDHSLQQRTPSGPARPDSLSRAGLLAQRNAIYAALTDLDFDHSVGKLNDDDYQVVRSQLMAQAVETLQQLDTSATTAPGIESEIEALVSARRAQRGPKSPWAPIARSGSISGLANAYCTACGSSLKPDDRFCGQCGSPVAARCPHCGTAVGPGDGFCVRCGAGLLAGAAA